MIKARNAKEIYQAEGEIDNGTFSGRWHFSFDEYYDPEFVSFGNLRVFNDDTLSPGAVWPLHPHSNIEVVTYCAEGEFRHEDEHGLGGILKKGWVQHTTVGSGMFHSEINNRKDNPMRFIQMWFFPDKHGLKPSIEQKQVSKEERTNKLLLLVSRNGSGCLKIATDAKIYSSFIEKGKVINCSLNSDHGAYLYILEGGPVSVNENILYELDAAKITEEKELTIKADKDAELLLVVVSMKKK